MSIGKFLVKGLRQVKQAIPKIPAKAERKFIKEINFKNEKLEILSNMQPEGMQNAAIYGKHKVPRYTYHLTTKKNYESMLKDGYIKPSNDALYGKGVFMTKLTNFFKRWKMDNSIGDSLQKKLIFQVSKGEDEIVILKIPTNKLEHNKLKIRSQNSLFNWAKHSGKEYLSIYFETIDRLKDVKPEKNWRDKFTTCFQNLFKGTDFYKTKEGKHLSEGALAKDTKLYTQRKQAIEYIYDDPISMNSVEKIGEVNLKELKSSNDYNSAKPIQSIFIKLLSGQPEVKGAQLLKC